MRRVEFDLDVFSRRDVRILVDGESVGAMPYPTPVAPLQDHTFDLDGYELTAVSWLPASSWAEGMPLRYDLFQLGRSLIDGASLDAVRAAAPRPGTPYPAGFRVIDITLRVVPGASAAGLVVGLSRSLATLGWPETIALLALLFGAIWLSTGAATRIWGRIKAEEGQSARSRTLRGWLAVTGTYAATSVVVVAVAIIVVRTGAGA